MSSHERKVALVTGGSRGIGFGIALALAQDGWDLLINGIRDQDQVNQSLDVLRAQGAEVHYCQGNVGLSADRGLIMQTTREYFDQLHLLVNNAGITSPGRKDILEATEEAFDQVLNVNLKGAFFLTQLAARWMIKQRDQQPDFRGCVINIGSISGEVMSCNRGDYCISWAGLAASTKLWATKLAAYGINVYEIRPGVIRTDMTAGVTEKYDRLIANGLTIEPRWGTPEDVGSVAAVLARGDFTYATGNVIMVDGGLTIPRL